MTRTVEIMEGFRSKLASVRDGRISGVVVSVNDLVIEAKGIDGHVCLGFHCRVMSRSGEGYLAEVVSVKDGLTVLILFQTAFDISVGCKVVLTSEGTEVYPTDAWLGRVIDGLGRPMDGGEQLERGVDRCILHSVPPPAHSRRRIGERVDMGIKSLNTFVACCRGQRLGVFSGSGVGKSVMTAMITKFASADVKIVGLIGERGREVQEFLEDYLGKDGLSKAIVVVATSDESPLMKKQATYLVMALCEYFRDRGRHVLCMLDSVTRFANAQRQIGLSCGELPTTRGYTASVFVELARLLERAGPGTEGQGDITGLFSVLVEGDDHNEPISDAVRGTLDGHIVLSRKIAARNVYPAIDVLNSISRAMPRCNTDDETRLLHKARGLLSDYEDMRDMIRLGAYKKGSDAAVDAAIKYNKPLEAFISQLPHEYSGIRESYSKLARAMEGAK